MQNKMIARAIIVVGVAALIGVSTSASARPRADQLSSARHVGFKTRAVDGVYLTDSGRYLPATANVRKYRSARYGQRQTARHRRNNRVALASAAATGGSGLFGAGGSLIAEARRYMGTNPTGRGSLWCGHFMNLILQRTGHAPSNSNTARSFASYGRRISGPQVGAIAVLSRGKRGGHVGVVTGVDGAGNPIIVSGNHNRRVGEGKYPRGRVIAYVMPN